MTEVIALHSFKHNGESRSRHEKWSTSDKDATALARAGLVRIKSSSKPAAPKKPVARKKTTGAKPAAKKAVAPKPATLTA